MSVSVEPTLQLLAGEQLQYQTADREDDVRENMPNDDSAQGFWGTKQQHCFSEIGFCMASCSYIYNYIYICQDGGAVGFVDFTKLSFALSSHAQPFDQMGSIPEYVFVILSQRKAYVGSFQKETAGKTFLLLIVNQVCVTATH